METPKERKNARQRGNNAERACAKAMSGVVVGRSKAVKIGSRGLESWVSVNCQQPPDVLAPGGFSFECKNTKLSRKVVKAVSQSVRNAPSGFEPYVWWYDRESDSTYIICTKRVFLDMHGKGGK